MGDSVIVTGTLTRKDKTPLSQVNGMLQYKVANGPWQTLTSGVTDSSGTLTAQLPLSAKTIFRFTSDGSWSVAAGQSADLALTPLRILTWMPPTSMKVATTYIVGGTVLPAVSGVKVHLLKDDTVMDSTATSADGTFSFTLEESKVGIVHFRVTVDADSLFAATSSQRFGTLLR